MIQERAIEKLFWSIAFPGFGQFLNGKYFKGTVLLLLEFLVNVQGNFNRIIILSFQGQMEQAIQQANYHWLMFYPCIYFYAIWDAYRDAGGARKPFSFMPFVFSAYFVTIGVIYSPFVPLLGPVWLPIISVIPGLLSGYFLQYILKRSVTSTLGGDK
ncbi:hypothetical protein J416_09659 [Gracilibacillus halophilus YIM-C55.5]|uniref:Uncharacterized protein n=1 Tax=Gracilibacillus halophilus YIM-C55.5 TaxID=1308866 RepID=N4W8M7_9BACI|nr:hypothetical protein [Gracilibacillus halophilus]ENH96633.1 hypothetical protein J416_09659 [Gracilibacillus halophilus YIM-C55.5]